MSLVRLLEDALSSEAPAVQDPDILVGHTVQVKEPPKGKWRLRASAGKPGFMGSGPSAAARWCHWVRR
jgi:hypothetical protein